MIYGVGVIVIKKDKILIGERGDGKGWCGGGGHIEEGETPRWAAVRELKEEFNIWPIGIKPIGIIKGVDGGEPYESHLFFADNHFGFPKGDGKEIINTIWVHLDSLQRMKLYPPFRKSLRYLPTLRNKYGWPENLEGTE